MITAIDLLAVLVLFMLLLAALGWACEYGRKYLRRALNKLDFLASDRRWWRYG